VVFCLLVFSCRADRPNRSQIPTKHPCDATQIIPSIDKSMRWYQAANPEKISAVALVVHGLNLRPDKMESIITLLTDSGIDVLNLSLQGHGRNYISNTHLDSAKARLEAFKTVSYQLWIDETYRAYHIVRERSAQKKLPLFFVGFSLGGLMGVDLFASYPDVYFDRMVLLAPALSMHAVNYTAKLLSMFPRLVIPSFTIADYRANKGTPMAAYNSVFEAVKHFNKNVNPAINVPTLIFIDQQDELISYGGLKRLVKDEQLDQWKFHHVQKGKTGVKEKMRHLIIDEPSVGQDMWQEMRIAITNHLLP
jgi:esterase/lipase